ncbi:hypothetical protein, partial [Nocardia sp. NPDC005366]|uniref:hypothetical protein n=1 Tax=Nocardia sp. NPDC005366 TaxID=3156878 RepID=UPI0033AB3942
AASRPASTGPGRGAFTDISTGDNTMSDPCIVGRLGGDTATGVYVHTDGAPQQMLERLGLIMARDGVRAALDTLTGCHYGFSYLWPEFDEGDSETNLSLPRHTGRVLEGYGFTYTIGPRMNTYTLADARSNPLINWAYFIDPAGGDIHWYETRPGAPEAAHVVTVWGRS